MAIRDPVPPRVKSLLTISADSGNATGCIVGRTSTATYPKCGVKRAIGSLVVREVDNTWVFEVQQGVLRAGGIQASPLRYSNNYSIRWFTAAGYLMSITTNATCRSLDKCL